MLCYTDYEATFSHLDLANSNTQTTNQTILSDEVVMDEVLRDIREMRANAGLTRMGANNQTNLIYIHQDYDSEEGTDSEEDTTSRTSDGIEYIEDIVNDRRGRIGDNYENTETKMEMEKAMDLNLPPIQSSIDKDDTFHARVLTNPFKPDSYSQSNPSHPSSLNTSKFAQKNPFSRYDGSKKSKSGRTPSGRNSDNNQQNTLQRYDYTHHTNTHHDYGKVNTVNNTRHHRYNGKNNGNPFLKPVNMLNIVNNVSKSGSGSKGNGNMYHPNTEIHSSDNDDASRTRSGSNQTDDSYHNRMQTYNFVENQQILHEHDMAIKAHNNDESVNMEPVMKYVGAMKELSLTNEQSSLKLQDKLSLKVQGADSFKYQHYNNHNHYNYGEYTD